MGARPLERPVVRRRRPELDGWLDDHRLMYTDVVRKRLSLCKKKHLPQDHVSEQRGKSNL